MSPPDRLFPRPRVDRFCPGIHCKDPTCGPGTCKCKPCHCQKCKARTAHARHARLKGPLVPPRATPQPRLFPSPDPRSQL